jgi:hypothetical protein
MKVHVIQKVYSGLVAEYEPEIYTKEEDAFRSCEGWYVENLGARKRKEGESIQEYMEYICEEQLDRDEKYEIHWFHDIRIDE